jgi:hypothetical protein
MGSACACTCTLCTSLTLTRSQASEAVQLDELAWPIRAVSILCPTLHLTFHQVLEANLNFIYMYYTRGKSIALSFG